MLVTTCVQYNLLITANTTEYILPTDEDIINEILVFELSSEPEAMSPPRGIYIGTM